MTSRRSDLLALILLGALATLLFIDVLAGSSSFYIRDVTHYYHPAKKVLREIVRDGEFPYWNPYFSAGQPLAANPEHEVFYPPTWLILLPSFETGFRLLLLLHVYLALFAMYALLRSLECGPPAAFIGALSFGLGGLTLSMLNLLPYLFCTAWLPLTCLYTRKFLQTGALRHFGLASLFLGLQVLVGEPTTIFQTGLLLGMYAIYAGRSVRAVLRVGLITLAAVLLAAVQILPLLDHFGDSVRARGLEFSFVSHWSMPLIRVGELVYPHLLGTNPLESARSPFFFSIYAGLAVAALAAGGILARARGAGLTVAVLAVSIVLALGGNTPLLRWLYDAGIARATRYPEKFIIIGVFALVVFGARMLEEVLRGNERVRKTTLGFLAAIALVAILATALRGGDRVWIVAAARALLLVLLLRNLARVRRPVWIAVLGLFVLLDLGGVVPQLAPRVPSSYFEEPPPIVRQFPAEREQFRIFHRAGWTMGQNVYFRPHPERWWMLRNGLFPMTPAEHGLRLAMEIDHDLTALQPTEDFVRSMAEIALARPNAWEEIAASMSNVWYRGVYREPNEALRRAGGVFRNVEPVRFLPHERYPRYYFADQIVTIRDRQDFVRKLSGAAYSKRVAFITWSGGLSARRRWAESPPLHAAPGVVRAWRERANGARIEVETAGRALLVMSVTPHKYWRVTVDGKETPAMTVNVGYQGVVVPAGRHVIETRYRNPLIALGAVISLAALAALAFCTMRAL